MLKNILNIEGVYKLNKKEQKSLEGGRRGNYGACYMKSGLCCDTSRIYPYGIPCEPGRCMSGGCLWY